MDAEEYRRNVFDLAETVLRAIRLAKSRGVSGNVACGVAAAVSDVFHATGGSDADILGTVVSAAVVRFKIGIQ